MASFTMNASGGINDSTKYVGGVAPSMSGTDTIILNDGVICTMNVSFEGGDPAAPTTPSIKCAAAAGTGVLQMSAGVTFTTKADVEQGNAAWTVAAGCTIWFKCDTALNWYAGDTTCPLATLTFSGTVGSHIIIKGTNTAGTANTTKHLGFHNKLGAATAVLNGTYIDCTDIGAAASDGHFWDTGFGRNSVTQTLKNFTGTRSGQLRVANAAATEGFDIENCSWYDSPESNGGRSLQIYSPTAPSGSPTRTIKNIFIKNGQFRPVLPTGTDIGGTVNNIVVISKSGSTALDESGAAPILPITNALFYSQSATDDRHDMPQGTHSTIIDLMDIQTSSTNFDGVNIQTANGLTINGAIFEQWRAVGNTGNPVPLALAAACTVTMRHTLVVPTTGGGTKWKSAIVPVFANQTGTSVTFENNTVAEMVAGVNQGKVLATENGTTTVAGVFPSAQSNLIWNSAANANSTMCDDRSATQANGMYGTCDFNNFFNFTAATQYPLAAAKYNVTPGTHDLAVNPSFVDSTRNFLKWGQSIDGSITDWITIVNRMDMNAAAFNPAYSISGTAATAYEWIRAGWTPTNVALKAAGASGTDIGAISVQVSTGGVHYKRIKGMHKFRRRLIYNG